MIRLVTLVLAACCYLVPGFLVPSLAHAEDLSKLVGTWKLVSWQVQYVGENAREALGPNPKGRLIVAPDGYWTVMIVKANRRPALNNLERASLLKSMLAYSGKFTVDGDKVTTAVDLSWNEVNTGKSQTRFVKLDGDKLVISTPEQASVLVPGKRVVATFTWEREK